MHFSKEKTAADAIRAAKPVVTMQRARVVRVPKTKLNVLVGYPINHPRERLNDKQIQTSTIIKVDGDVYETHNTVYHILNWDNDGN